MKPRIGIMAPRLGITDRGAETLVYELTKNLQTHFDFTVWVRSGLKQTRLIADLQKLGVKVKQINCFTDQHWLANLLCRPKFLRPLLEKIHLTPFEIEMFSFSINCLPQLLSLEMDILFPANGVWGVLVCRIIRALRKTPYIYASLGGIEPVIAKLKPNLYIAIHPSTKNWLNTYYPDLMVTYIPAGVDLNKFKSGGKKAQIDLPRPIFLTVSALVPEKRVDLTIQAVGKLNKGSLLIIGDGRLKVEVMEMAQKYLGSTRFLFQNVGYDRLDEYYRAADVFTHSAPNEKGWSMVHLEAMATNLPVVGNQDKDIIKLLQKAGITCDVTIVNEYAKALSQASRSSFGNLPRKTVIQYSWKKIAAQYQKNFYLVLKSKR